MPSLAQSFDKVPTLEGLFARYRSFSLLQFPLFNFSPFRSPSSLPDGSLLDPLRILTVSTETQPSSSPTLEVSVAKESLFKALVGLQRYDRGLRESLVTDKTLDLKDHKVEEKVQGLMEGFLKATYLIATTSWTVTARDQGSKRDDLEVTEIQDLRTGLLRCIKGFFETRSILDDHHPTSQAKPKPEFPIMPAKVEECDQHILGSIFRPDETIYPYLACLFVYPRHALKVLRTHPSRPMASLPHTSSPLSAETSPAHETVSDAGLSWIFDVLNTYLDGLKTLNMLNKSESKEEGEYRHPWYEGDPMELKWCDATGRPLRLGIEVRLLLCDLALSMTTQNMGQVKARALMKFGGEVGEAESDGEGDVSDVEEENLRGLNDEEVEVKSEDRLDENESTSKKGCNGESLRGPSRQHDSAGDEVDPPKGVKWEDTLEDIFVQCLETFTSIVTTEQRPILEEDVEALHWVGKHGIAKKPQVDVHDDSSSSLLVEIEPLNDDDSQRERVERVHDFDDSSSESDFESDDTSVSEYGYKTLNGPEPRWIPLQYIFRLHDRYEEQRLAIWLSLPSSSRGKMAKFMRGENERVGNAWDALGLELLDTLEEDRLRLYGLGRDKLDKWLELASSEDRKRQKNTDESDTESNAIQSEETQSDSAQSHGSHADDPQLDAAER
ncbi:hypothetical protein IAR55_002563 [Kwoniella newhampshirensis]|uniref:HNH nuclease domain-containing protein n=1 Tax=Kwoniella newhampshirensis TaxID=1651941 RepID=A0AAW0Z1T2_9TREE